MHANRSLPPLRFRGDGTFTVMQISDIQDCTGDLPERTRTMLEAALDQEKPDFAVLTGDQLKGYGASLWFSSQAEKEDQCARTIRSILALLEARGIPFSLTLGNHDHDAPMSAAEQLRVYQGSALCYAQDTPDVPGYGNHAIQILRSRNDEAALNFYLLDTHPAKAMGVSFQPLRPEQVEWYRRTRDALMEQNGGTPVPSMLFQHVPVEEVMRLYRRVPRGARGAMEGYRNYQSGYYILDEAKVVPGSFSGELPSSPDQNAGLFEAAKEKGDMLGMYFGHDHNNGFHGTVDGIDLGYAPGAGYSSYGPGRRRGVRLFRFREDDPRAYETYVVTDAALLGPNAPLPARSRVIDRTPSSFGAARPLLRRGAIGLAALSLGLAGAIFAGRVKGRRA